MGWIQFCWKIEQCEFTETDDQAGPKSAYSFTSSVIRGRSDYTRAPVSLQCNIVDSLTPKYTTSVHCNLWSRCFEFWCFSNSKLVTVSVLWRTNINQETNQNTSIRIERVPAHLAGVHFAPFPFYNSTIPTSLKAALA